MILGTSVNIQIMNNGDVYDFMRFDQSLLLKYIDAGFAVTATANKNDFFFHDGAGRP